uniref:Uncharacterized protein n=1 Tax=Amphimedon queenslandica TaxID=400682 RepID=A0A1X7VY02_AMPQE
MSTASLPYQFTLVEGGEFRSDSSYGCISRREFCLVCACGECNGGGRGTTESLPSGSSSLAEQNAHQQLESHDSDSTSVQSQLSEATKYAGLVYYEEREDLVTFTAAKKLNALLEHIKKEYSHAKRGLNVYFRIASPDGFIELNLNAPQDELFTGWIIFNNFGDEEYSLPPSCPISVYGSIHAVPTLHYSIPLEGVVCPVTLYIHRSLRTTNPSASSSSNTFTEVTAVSSNGGASLPANVDVARVKKVINGVLVSHHASLTSLKTSLSDLASQL